MLCHAKIHPNIFSTFTAVANSALQPLQPRIFSSSLNQAKRRDCIAAIKPPGKSNHHPYMRSLRAQLHTKMVNHMGGAARTIVFHDEERLTRRDQLERNVFYLIKNMNNLRTTDDTRT